MTSYHRKTGPITSTRPRVYCASPAHRLKMWQMDLLPPSVHVVSTWHTNTTFAADDQDPDACARYWGIDFSEIRQADALLAYAEYGDKPNGTLVEIGYALAHDTPVALVGNFNWGTWKHLPLVTHYPTLREAAAAIIGEAPEAEAPEAPSGASEGEPL